MFGRQVFLGQVLASLTLLVLRHIVGLSGVNVFLSGVKAFFTQDASAAAAQQQQLLSEAKSKKERKQIVKQHLTLKGAAEQNIYMQPLGPKTLKALTFMEDFDNMVLLAGMLVVNTVFSLLLVWVLGIADNPMMSVLSLVILVYVTYLTLKVDVLSEMRQLSDKAHLVVLGGIGFLAAALILAAVPTSVLDFGLQPGLKGLDVGVTSFLGRVHMRLAHLHKKEDGKTFAAYQSNEQLMIVGIASFAGFMVAALSGPAMRFAKLLYHSSTVPAWGSAYIRPGWLSLRVAQLAYVAPLVAAALHFKPLVAYWGLPLEWMPFLQCTALLLVAVLHALCITPMSQAWLNTGLLEWYSNRHSGLEHPRKTEIVKLRLDFIRSLLGKVASQLTGLIPIVLAAGVLLSFHGPNGLMQLLVTDSARAPVVAAAQRLADMTGPAGANLLEPVITGSWGRAGNVTGTGSRAAGQLDEAAVDGPLPVLDEVPDLTGVASSSSPDSVVAAMRAQGADLHDLFSFLGRFLGWWACVVWMVFACSASAVYRLGLNAG